MEARSAARPRAGAAAPEPPSVCGPEAHGAWPQARSQGHGGQGQECADQLEPQLSVSRTGRLSRPPHLRLNLHTPLWAAVPASGQRAAVLSEHRQTRGLAALQPQSPASPARCRAGWGAPPLLRNQGACSASQVTGNNPAINQCTHRHWQSLKRKITRLPSPNLHLNGDTPPPAPRAAVSTQAELGEAGRSLPRSPTSSREETRLPLALPRCPPGSCEDRNAPCDYPSDTGGTPRKRGLGAPERGPGAPTPAIEPRSPGPGRPGTQGHTELRSPGQAPRDPGAHGPRSPGQDAQGTRTQDACETSRLQEISWRQDTGAAPPSAAVVRPSRRAGGGPGWVWGITVWPLSMWGWAGNVGVILPPLGLPQ